MIPGRSFFSTNGYIDERTLWTDGILDRSRNLFRFPEILHTLLAFLLYVTRGQYCSSVKDLMTFVGLMSPL